MYENQQRTQGVDVRRQSMTLLNSRNDEKEETRSRNGSINTQHRPPTSSQIYIPFGDQYKIQARAPPTGVEFQQQFVLKRVEEAAEPIDQRQLSIISEDYCPIDDEENARTDLINEDNMKRKRKTKCHRQILFIVEPIFAGLILLPIIALFWDCGWNLVWIFLEELNGNPSTLKLNMINDDKTSNYSVSSLLVPYFIVQIMILIFHLRQDFFYNFFKKQTRIVRKVLLKCHIFVLVSLYIIQWQMLWTVWDEYTPHEWYFELVLSISSLLTLIVIIGHLSDLICAPFLISYDSIEYCLHHGCPLLTREVSLLLQFNK